MKSNQSPAIRVLRVLFFATLALTLRGQSPAFVWALLAFACIVGTQVVFWTFTYPVNQATSNWTMLPSDWESLRARWEYSHAGSAVLNLAALVSTIVAILSAER